jgi:hypothetical protein
MSLPLTVLTTQLELIAATAETVSLELRNVEQFATGELSRQCSRAPPIRVVEFAHQLLGPASDGERSRSTHNAEYSSATPAHPLRSATIGSTPAARRAGIAEASSAATASSTAASRSMTGSQNLTPKS